MSDFKQRMETRNADPEILDFVRPDYTFHPDFVNQFSCPDTTINGVRHYNIGEGAKYPSITTVLSGSKSERAKKSLDNWKKRVGPVEAERVSTGAKERGNKLHKIVEWFITNDAQISTVTNKKDILLFSKIHPLLTRINNIRGIESVLYLDALNLAGRTDLVADFDGEGAIIDIKGSTKIKEEYFIRDYFIQETFYALAYSKMYNTKIKKIVTIMATEQSDTPQLFVKDAADYVGDLIARVKTYNERKANGTL